MALGKTGRPHPGVGLTERTGGASRAGVQASGKMQDPGQSHSPPPRMEPLGCFCQVGQLSLPLCPKAGGSHGGPCMCRPPPPLHRLGAASHRSVMERMVQWPFVDLHPSVLPSGSYGAPFTWLSAEQLQTSFQPLVWGGLCPAPSPAPLTPGAGGVSAGGTHTRCFPVLRRSSGGNPCWTVRVGLSPGPGVVAQRPETLP